MASKIKIGPYSAYAIAVKYGYQGTEEEWIKEQEANRTASETAAKEAAASAAAALNSAGAAEASSKAAETAKTQAEAAAAKAEAAASAAEKDAGSARSDAQAAAASEQAANASRGSAEASASAAQRSETAAAASASQAAGSAAAANETLTQVQTAGQEAQQKVKDAETEALGNISAAAPALPAVSAAAAWQSVTAKPDGTGYNLASMAPIEATIRPTVTGNPAVCKDSAAWAFQGLAIYGKSTQDGTPSPENPVPIVSAGDGGSVGVEITGANLIRTHGSETINGVAFTDNGDGTITVNGTATKEAIYYFTGRDNPFDFVRKNTNYFLSGCPSGASGYRIQWWNYNGLSGFAYDKGSGVSVNCSNVDEDYNICIYVVSGVTVNNAVFKPMLNYGTKAMPFEPYKSLQEMAVSTPNGLPGIPVISGGNYIDAGGQQWVCNVVNLETKNRIQNVAIHTFTGEEKFQLAEREITQDGTGGVFYISKPDVSKNANQIGGYCSNFKYEKTSSIVSNNSGLFDLKYQQIRFSATGFETVSDFQNFVSELFKSNNPVKVLYPLESPVISPLSEEELSTYRALTTYSGATVVSTAEPMAGLEVQYMMDGNKYRESVDKRLAALEAAQTGI